MIFRATVTSAFRDTYVGKTSLLENACPHHSRANSIRTNLGFAAGFLIELHLEVVDELALASLGDGIRHAGVRIGENASNGARDDENTGLAQLHKVGARNTAEEHGPDQVSCHTPHPFGISLVFDLGNERLARESGVGNDNVCGSKFVDSGLEGSLDIIIDRSVHLEESELPIGYFELRLELSDNFFGKLLVSVCNEDFRPVLEQTFGKSKTDALF